MLTTGWLFARGASGRRFTGGIAAARRLPGDCGRRKCLLFFFESARFAIDDFLLQAAFVRRHKGRERSQGHGCRKTI